MASCAPFLAGQRQGLTSDPQETRLCHPQPSCRKELGRAESPTAVFPGQLLSHQDEATPCTDSPAQTGGHVKSHCEHRRLSAQLRAFRGLASQKHRGKHRQFSEALTWPDVCLCREGKECVIPSILFPLCHKQEGLKEFCANMLTLKGVVKECISLRINAAEEIMNHVQR